MELVLYSWIFLIFVKIPVCLYKRLLASKHCLKAYFIRHSSSYRELVGADWLIHGSQYFCRLKNLGLVYFVLHDVHKTLLEHSPYIR